MANLVQLYDDGGTLRASSSGLSAICLLANGIGGPGWVIKASAGTYNEMALLTNGVSLQGANAGLDGTDDARGPETIITGGVEVRSSGSTVDGVEISGSFDTRTIASIDFPALTGLV